jgi:hypothetical protein
MKVSYDPAAKFELKVSEVDFLRTPGGRQLMARIYQPQGGRAVSHHARSARWGLATQGPLRRGADGPCDRGKRRRGGGHRPAAL